MAKPKIPSQKSRYGALNQRLNKYLLLVQQIFDDLNLEAAKAATSVSYDTDAGKPFRFSDYPTLAQRVKDLQKRYVDDIGAVIYSGTSAEWKKSNEVQDLLADGVLKAYGAQVSGQKYKIYYQPNNDALKAFQKRRANGMTLSQKLWNQAGNYRQEMEYAISSAIEKGTSAVTLSKRLSKYLHDFPSLQKDYKEKFGKAADCHDCEYRSMRLARSEINMAYRTAEQTRWEQMDFVVGYEIKLSGSHPAEDICDMLKGKYPKDFVWTGWHPNDLCYKIPILKTEEEFWNYGEARNKPSSKEVTDVPVGFKEWVADNEKRISKAKRNGTLPYFLKDNPSVMSDMALWSQVKDVRSMALAVGGEVQDLAEGIAERFGGVVTPINYKSFDSISRKCKTEGCTPFDLKDAVRNTIIVDEDKIEDVLSALEESGMVLRIKRQTPDKFMGYSGNIVNITTSSGMTAEIQVNTAKMIYAKETPAVAKSILGEDVWNRIAKETGLEGGLGHKYYEQFRVLDKLSPKAAEIEGLSKEYYSHFAISKPTALDIAVARHSARTEDQIDKIRSEWSKRRIKQLNDYLLDGHLPDEVYETTGRMYVLLYSKKYEEIQRLSSPLIRAAERHKARTKKQIESIKARWNERKEAMKLLQTGEEKFIANDWAAMRQRSNIVAKYNTDESLQESLAKNFDVLGFSDGLESLVTADGGTMYEMTITRANEKRFEFEWRGWSKDGEPITLCRSFSIDRDGKLECHHDLFAIPESMQGKGFSRKVFQMLYKEYQRMGVDYITVFANIDVGGYCWAKYGFKAKNHFNAVSCFEGLSDDLLEKALNFIDDYYKTNNLPHSAPFPMKLLAQQPWGKDALLNSSWIGILDLSDRAEREFFEKYMFSR